MDPLEDVLALVGTTSYLSTGMTAGGSWAVRFEPPTGVKFNSVRRGSCLIQVDGVAEPLRLERDDVFLLTRPSGFVLANDLAVPPVPAREIFAAATDGMAHTGDGDDVEVIGGGFSFNERAAAVLLPSLPAVLHIPAAAPEATTVRWALQRIGVELRERPLGAGVAARHLAMIMFIEALRLQLSRSPGVTSGWLAGLADPVVAPAIRALHSHPGRPWTVARLAQVSRVSRSTLAARFKKIVGTGPLDYLTGWRIELAAQRLTHGDETLDAIARAVGYGSESALSTAFKRVTGTSPSAYRRRAAAG